MTEKDQFLLKTLLEELENAHSEGKIDDAMYDEFKARYLKKLEDISISVKDAPPIAVNMAGSRTLTDDAMIISGSANITGGNLAKNLIIEGSARIAGSLKCLAIKVGGDLKCNANLEAQREINCAGSITVAGNLKGHSDALFASSTNIGGNADLIGNLRSTGVFHTRANLRVDGWVNAGGALTIGGNIIVNGAINSTGTLSCNGNFRSNSEVKLSGAVTIHGNARSYQSFTSTAKTQLKGNLTAEDIQLGNAEKLSTFRVTEETQQSIIHGNVLAYNDIFLMDCEVRGCVSGKNVVIGPNTIVHGNVRFVEGYKCAENTEIYGRFQQWSIDNLQSQFSKKDLEIFQAGQSGTNFPQNLAMATKNVEVETYDAAALLEVQSMPPIEQSDLVNGILNFCPGCGAKIEQFMRFCPVCGTSLLQ